MSASAIILTINQTFSVYLCFILYVYTMTKRGQMLLNALVNVLINNNY